jgi:hypothetical protein
LSESCETHIRASCLTEMLSTFTSSIFSHAMSQDAQSFVKVAFMCCCRIVMLTRVLHDVSAFRHSFLQSQISVPGSTQQFCFMILDPFTQGLSRFASAETGACPVLVIYDKNSASRALFANVLSRTTGSTSMIPVRSGSVKMIFAI